MAVFTKVSPAAFEEFAVDYGLKPPFSLNPILEGIENTNYRVGTASGDFVLTLLEGRSQDIDGEKLTGLLDHLHGAGLPVPQPLQTGSGDHIRPLMDRPAILVSWLSGTSVEIPGVTHCRLAGQALAKLHIAGNDFKDPGQNLLPVSALSGYFEGFRDQLSSDEPGLCRSILGELDFIEKNWPIGLPSGLTHSDFFPDNLLFQDDKVSGLLDFYYSCEDYFAYDLAIAITAWCGQGSDWPRPGLMRSLLDGYESVRPLEDSEKQSMPVLLRGACLRFALTRLHDWITTPKDAMIVKKDPSEYLAKLETAKDWDGFING